MIPTRRLLLLLGLAGFVAALAPSWPWAGPMALGLDAALLAVAAWDARRIPPLGALAVARHLPASAVVGAPVAVEIEVGAPRGAQVRIAEAPPEALGEIVVAAGRAAPGAPFRHAYEVRPSRRGRWAWAPSWVTVTSPLGLVSRHGSVDIPGDLHVHPQVPAGGGLAVPAVAYARRSGPRSGPRPGAGADFLHLRPLAPGDSLRAVDWKATARRGTPVVRQHAEERALTVMLILDLSRRMAQRVGEVSLLDLSIASALELARAASDAGDRVGLIAFGARVRCHLPPRAGRRALPEIREALVDLQPEERDADPQLAFTHLEAHRIQRSLLVMFTDVARPDAAPLARPVAVASRRHPVVLAGVEDAPLAALASGLPRDGEGALVKGAALVLEAERRQATRELAKSGAWVVEVPPGALPSAVVGRYLALRARG